MAVMEFAALMRDLMREREVSGRCLARRVPCDASLISRLSRGLDRPSARIAALLDRELGASGALIEAARSQAGTARLARIGWCADEFGDADVRRRELLGAMAAGPLALQLEQIRRHLDGLSVVASERDADEWERVAAGYARKVWGMPAAVYLPHLLADTGELTERVMSASGSVRVRLTRSAAKMAALTAIGLAAVGDGMTAARWWRTSARVAEGSGDGELAALVLGKQAAKAIYGPGGNPDALVLADRAVAAGGGRVCAGVVSAHAGRAQALAGLGRRGEALAAVADHKRGWERLPDADVSAAGSEFGQPELRVRHTEAWVLVKLGATRPAVAALDAYLMYPVSSGRRAKMELLRAEALIRAGDVDGGARHCVGVLSGLPGAWRGEWEVLSSARAALGAVPVALGSRPAVREAREVLALSAGGS